MWIDASLSVWQADVLPQSHACLKLLWKRNANVWMSCSGTSLLNAFNIAWQECTKHQNMSTVQQVDVLQAHPLQSTQTYSIINNVCSRLSWCIAGMQFVGTEGWRRTTKCTCPYHFFLSLSSFLLLCRIFNHLHSQNHEHSKQLSRFACCFMSVQRDPCWFTKGLLWHSGHLVAVLAVDILG